MVFHDRAVYQEEHTAQLIMARRLRSSPQRPNTFAQTCPSPFAFPLQSRGGPYISGTLLSQFTLAVVIDAPASIQAPDHRARMLQKTNLRWSWNILRWSTWVCGALDTTEVLVRAGRALHMSQSTVGRVAFACRLGGLLLAEQRGAQARRCFAAMRADPDCQGVELPGGREIA